MEVWSPGEQDNFVPCEHHARAPIAITIPHFSTPITVELRDASDVPASARMQFYDSPVSTEGNRVRRFRIGGSGSTGTRTVWVSASPKVTSTKLNDRTIELILCGTENLVAARIAVTAFNVDLDVNNNLSIKDAVDGFAGYLPGEEGGVHVLSTGKTLDTVQYVGQHMKIIAEGIGRAMGIDEVRFEIIEVTQNEGWTGNVSHPHVEGSDRNDDFSFREIGNQRRATGTMTDTRTWVDIWCKDTGGNADTRMILMRCGEPILTIR